MYVAANSGNTGSGLLHAASRNFGTHPSEPLDAGEPGWQVLTGQKAVEAIQHLSPRSLQESLRHSLGQDMLPEPIAHDQVTLRELAVALGSEFVARRRVTGSR
jgi:hypothetical protein